MQLYENDCKPISYRNSKGLPPTICIQLLDWCNLTCKNCRSDSSPRKKQQISFSNLLPVLTQLREFGLWRISLTGGEPFYWDELPRLLNLLYDLTFPFSVTTNGFSSHRLFDAIDPKVWQSGTMHISIDGDSNTHNNIRGEGSYERAFHFMKYIRPIVNRLNVNTVLFTEPGLWAKELYTELEKYNVENWTIISPVKQGREEILFDGNQNWANLYSSIQRIANGKTTTTFLDFAKTDKVLTDIIFINSDGSIRLPGYLIDLPLKPKSTVTHLSDPDLIKKTIAAVNAFIQAENYML